MRRTATRVPIVSPPGNVPYLGVGGVRSAVTMGTRQLLGPTCEQDSDYGLLGKARCPYLDSFEPESVRFSEVKDCMASLFVTAMEMRHQVTPPGDFWLAFLVS